MKDLPNGPIDSLIDQFNETSGFNKFVHRLMGEFNSLRKCDLVLISWVCKDHFQSCLDPILLEQDIVHRRGEHLGSHELKLLVLYLVFGPCVERMELSLISLGSHHQIVIIDHLRRIFHISCVRLELQ